MRNLKCFVLGMASIMVVFPIVESATEIICGKLEKVKAKNTIDILKLNKEIEELQIQLGDYHNESNAIGFQVEPCENYEEDEEWEEDDKTIGFI